MNETRKVGTSRLPQTSDLHSTEREFMSMPGKVGSQTRQQNSCNCVHSALGESFLIDIGSIKVSQKGHSSRELPNQC